VVKVDVLMQGAGFLFNPTLHGCATRLRPPTLPDLPPKHARVFNSVARTRQDVVTSLSDTIEAFSHI